MPSASIQRIIDIQPIEGADKIELAKVMGWQVVTAKDNGFKVGDFCIYVEIDSLVPDHPEFEFLRDRHFRVRTIKLRGELSQGLILPLSVLESFRPNERLGDIFGGWPGIGDDVSEILGITHYEKPVPAQLAGIAKGNFPGFLTKTDEDMIQSHMELLDAIQGKPYYITLKLDGTSGTFYKTADGEFGACSRNIDLKETEDNVYWKMVHKYYLDSIKPGVYLQGEICGPGIQKNYLGLKELDLFIFNVKFIEGNKQIPFPEMVQTLEYPGKCKMVPILRTGENFDFTLEQLIQMAAGQKYNNGSPAEGIVVRSQDGNISFKVLNNNYLLKEKE